ncbi:hypothetical protein BGZ80_008404 [Entomortierella chlamydospora]|uniref:Penicillin-binding protein n=1 Tax=Entomortierella chlamydospora TaxID=101097 RepID=A0A9P6MXY9_9FUNG|nr:hypothetical protein BGZ80_008404 [Entomortierella chlamydospora]
MKLIPLSILVLQGLTVIQAAKNEVPKGSRGNSTTPLANIRRFLEETRIQNGIPGMSVAILHKGKLIFAEGFGKRNDREPFTPETLTMIGSVTKSFTAAAVGELVTEGKVDWDTTPVSKYLPEFEASDPVLTSELTLEDLLSHRSGFPVVDASWFYNTESRKELVKRMKYVKMDTKLRPYSKYNNVMTSIAGIAAANAVDMEYEDLVRQKLIKPLGLNNTGFSIKEMSKHRNYAVPYDAASFSDAKSGKFKQLSLESMATGVAAPAGGLYSNVLDLVRWGQTIMRYGEQDGNQVLSKDSVIETLSAQSIYSKGRRTPEFSPSLTYGMGWILDSYKGSGKVDGYISNLALFPDSELVVAHLTNIYSNALPEISYLYIADEILGLPKTMDWAQMAISGTQQWYDEANMALKGFIPERVKNKPPSHDLREFAGDYTDPVYGDLTIRVEKGHKGKEELRIKLRVFEGKLEHYHFDSFKTTLAYSVIHVTQLVTFVTGKDGKVTGVQVTLESEVKFQKKK